MRARRPIISERRFTRLVAWLGALFVWFAAGGLRVTAAERRRGQRFAHLQPRHLARAVRQLIVMRAALRVRRLPRRRMLLDFAPSGFKRRIFGRPTFRSLAGSWIRRRLKVRGGIVAQAVHLIAMLKHLDAFAARILRRLRAGATRMRPILIAAPPADAVRSRDLSAPCAADTS